MINKIRFLCFLILFLVFTYPRTVAGAGASLEFVPSNLTLKKDEQTKISLKLNPSGGEIVGVDIFLRYDPQKIKVIDVVNLGSFPLQPAEKIDSAVGEVKTVFSNDYGSYVTSEVTFAEIIVQA